MTFHWAINMRKFTLNALAIVAFAGLMLLLTGCDPEKVGGGGLMQAYDAVTGRYK